MKFDADRLYDLLPAVYRIRDARLASEGEVPPLRALIEILADELDNIEENLDQLYDDQFIETCQQWVIPYIGKLVGNRALVDVPNAKFSKRSEVANTITYRRRKGTASVIEQLAHDLTGWDTNVVEFFDLLITTQYLNHLRPHNITTASLRDWEKLEYANSPFDKMAKTVDVRNISVRRGKYNIPNIGVFIWRVTSQYLTDVHAFAIEEDKYTFHPMGIDVPLYKEAISEDEITHLAQPENVSLPVSRRMLYEDLEAWTHQDADEPYQEKYFASDESASQKIVVRVDDHMLTPEEWRVCNLSDDSSGGWLNMPEATQKVVIDPQLGRIAFPPDFTPDPSGAIVRVSCNHGIGLQIGGGNYDRKMVQEEIFDGMLMIVPSDDHTTIQSAINELGEDGGIIEIGGNATYNETISVNLGENKQLIIRASDGNRPTLIFDGPAEIIGGANSRVEINGLLMDGDVIHVPEDSLLAELNIRHSTLRPAEVGNQIQVNSDFTQLNIDRSIVSGILLAKGANTMITDSIVDVVELENWAISGPDGSTGGSMRIENSTIVGRISARQIELASNSIFTSQIQVAQVQKGCMRFSWFPLSSVTPKAYKCQPSHSGDEYMNPVFNSMKFGDPRYLQLSHVTAMGIINGAENGSEMGVYYQQFTAQKIANLRFRLDEYLRFGLEAGVFLAS